MEVKKLLELKKYIEELKTINLEKSSDPSSFIRSDVYNALLNNGNTITREKIVKGGKNGSAAIIVPVTHENNTVLVVEPRIFTKRSVGIGFPAGYIEPEEKGIDAALRELKEEIGYIPDEVVCLGGFYQDSGCSSAYNQIFLAKGCRSSFNQSLDSDEFIRYFECSFEDVEELIDNSYIEGSNSIIAYERAKRYMKRRY